MIRLLFLAELFFGDFEVCFFADGRALTLFLRTVVFFFVFVFFFAFVDRELLFLFVFFLGGISAVYHCKDENRTARHQLARASASGSQTWKRVSPGLEFT